MSPQARRVVIPFIIGLVVILVVAAVVFAPDGNAPPIPPEGDAAPHKDPAVNEDVATVQPDQVGDAGAAADAEPTDADGEPANGENQAPPPGAAPEQLEGLRAVFPPVPPVGGDQATSLGSLDPRNHPMLVELSRVGAGVTRITLSDHWLTAEAKRRAEAHYAALRRGAPQVPPLPDEALRYVLTEAPTVAGVTVPVFAANSVKIDGVRVALGLGTQGRVWNESAPGVFETLVVDAAEQPIVRITRTYVLGVGNDITLRQRVQNLVDRPLRIQFSQFGPGGMPEDRSRYLDRRRFRMAYLLSAGRDPGRTIVQADRKLMVERGDLIKQKDDFVWPNKISRENDYTLSWFAATNRYFALAVHPVLDESGQGDKSLERTFMEVTRSVANDREVVFTAMLSPVRMVEAGGHTDFDIGIYAGPQDPGVLGKVQPYAALTMRELILYQMSSCCAVCTFQWLAKLLIGFLSLLHDYVVFDWGVAIIVLVLVVRALLHPLTKRGQIQMQRMGKKMQTMKPEMDKVREKYPNDPKKVQQEQVRLMREHNVSPTGCLGVLPMFLQMPIWVALYAMLYFAWELRQEPAFYGVFQHLAGWPFLADLSAADHCLWEFAEPFRLLGFWNITGINLLPFLMSAIFYVQQKYMAPPPSPTMTKEQVQQQKIMRIMMVVMFPLMLYSAPSGLTLYILTSSAIGVFESRYIRAHIKEMDEQPDDPAGKKKEKKKKKKRARGAVAKAYEEAQKQRAEKLRFKREKPRNFKKRKR